MNKFLIILWRAALVGLVVVVLIGAVNRKVVFSGRLELKQSAGRKSAYFSQILPDERASEVKKDQKGRLYKDATAEPLYIDLKMPRNFDQLELEVSYQNDSVPQVALGVQVGPENQYDLKPVENQNIDRIMADSATWEKIQSNDVLFFQRRLAERKVSSFDDFLKNVPEVADKIAIFNYNLSSSFRLKDYKPSNSELIINRSIRGSHQILTYIKNEPLEFLFKVQDINRREGADAVEIIIYKDGRVISTQNLEDDGLVSNLDPSSAPRFIEFTLPNLAEGVYRIELRTNDDIFFREIRTRQSRLTFLNRLYLADNEEYQDGFPDLRTDPTAVYTNGSRLKAFTAHQEGLQKIQIGDDQFDVNQTHQNFVFRKPIAPGSTGAIGSAGPSPTNVYKLISPKNDLQLETNGLFAFSQEQFFNPNFRHLDTELSDLSHPDFGLDYIAAKYNQPKVINGLKVARASFDLSRVYKKDNKIRLVISAPEISASKTLKIYQIKATLKGREIFWSDLKDRIFKNNDYK